MLRVFITIACLLSRDLQDVAAYTTPLATSTILHRYHPATSSRPFVPSSSSSSSRRSIRQHSQISMKLPNTEEVEDGLSSSARSVKESFVRGCKFVGHVDRFLGSFFDLPRLSYGVNLLLLNLLKGIALPFPSLRNVLLLRGKQEGAPLQDDDDDHTMSLGLSLGNGLLFLASYLIVGVGAYSYVFEKWPIIDSLYFSCVCLTTVGYGDLIPSTTQSQAFTSLFGLGGIALLGSAIATVGSRIVHAEVDTVETSRAESVQRVMQIFEGMPNVLSTYRRSRVPSNSYLESLATSHLKMKFPDKIKTVSLAEKIMRFVPALSIVLIGGSVMNYFNGGYWSIFESLYYSIVTASTIGFGDLAPRTPAARLFAVFFIPLSVAAAGELISAFTLSLLRKRQRAVYEKQLKKDLSIEHLRVMDANRDGRISREEYVQFMLLEMGLVSKECLNELYNQFDRLDVYASGYLDNDDLKMIAELRGATVKD